METRGCMNIPDQTTSNVDNITQKVTKPVWQSPPIDNKYNPIAYKNIKLNLNASNIKKNVKIDSAPKTPVQEFYSGQSIFITGGTGFLGKILIQKLLRTCPDIATIYLLVRQKGNHNVESRLDNMFQMPIFDRLKEEVPNFRNKIVPVEADFSVDGLGLSYNEENFLMQDVSVVFHMAASVHFKQTIKNATMININVTRYLLDIAKNMKKLKAFIYVSTVYANCHARHNDERFYTYPIDHKIFLSLTDNLSEEVASKTISSVFSQWPNVYTYTKAIAESLLKEASEDIPIGIYRPASIVSTARDPIAGWVDNYYGPNGVSAFYYKGLMRFMIGDPNCTANIVPADITVNALIATAWDVFTQSHRRGDKTLIYNHVATNDARLTWGEYMDYGQQSMQKYPLKNCYWMPTITLIREKLIYKICIWLTHLLPALLMDAVQTCRGVRESIWTFYKKIHNFSNVIHYFTTREWTYTNDNIHAMWHRLSKEDQRLLNFNMKGFDWPKYLDNHIKGLRIYLLKDDISSLEASRIRWKRLYWIHQAVRMIFTFAVLWFIWRLVTKILA
ncbi:fatty acyl-CoA reductase wat-like [Odontomachus brunneus]|uniref:fatty acyl-CoA reductase wat-like n=1 Tax=Odontomachus brunneus TaxID=486640 RepID=UPI0013F2786D|nr:fatty acyl-CoA reductase wat-like [Odontomachus brunneus]